VNSRSGLLTLALLASACAAPAELPDASAPAADAARPRVDARTAPEDGGPPDAGQASPDASPADAAEAGPDAGLDAALGADAAEEPDASAAVDAAQAAPDAALAGPDASEPDGGGILTWTDPSTGLEWLQTNVSGDLDWGGANNYCSDLGGGWRLPSLDEMRTTVRGCPGSEAGGGCPLGASCASSSCGTLAACLGCAAPGTGCLRDPAVLGACENYWSATLVSDDATAWSINFRYATFAPLELTTVLNFRCVR